jgi:hypothetical protein
MQNTDAKNVRADAILRRHLPSKCHGLRITCTGLHWYSLGKFVDTKSYEVTHLVYTVPNLCPRL